MPFLLRQKIFVRRKNPGKQKLIRMISANSSPTHFLFWASALWRPRPFPNHFRTRPSQQNRFSLTSRAENFSSGRRITNPWMYPTCFLPRISTRNLSGDGWRICCGGSCPAKSVPQRSRWNGRKSLGNWASRSFSFWRIASVVLPSRCWIWTKY